MWERCWVGEAVLILPLVILCVGFVLLAISKVFAGGVFSAHISLLSAFLGFASCVNVWYLSRLRPLQYEIEGWDPVPGHPASVVYHADSWAALFAVIALATVLAAVLLRVRLSFVFPHRNAWGDALLLALGAVFTNLVFSASAIPLVSSWVFLGLLAYAGAVTSPGDSDDRDSAQSALAMSCISGSFLLVVAIMVGRALGYEAVFGDLGQGQVTFPVLVLLLFALATYAGLFPLHVWVTELGSLPSSLAATSSILAGVAAVYLLGRFRFMVDGAVASPFAVTLAALGCASAAYGAVSAWTTSDFKMLLRHLATVELGYAFVAIGLGSPLSLAAATLIAVNLVLSGGAVSLYVLELRSRGIGGETSLISRNPLELGLVLLAYASLVGAPPLLGFFAKWMLYNAAIVEGYGVVAMIVFGISSVSTVPFVKSMDHLLFSRSDLGWQHPELHSLLSLAAVGVLQLPNLAIGLLPWISLRRAFGPSIVSILSSGFGPFALAGPGSLSFLNGPDRSMYPSSLVAALAAIIPFAVAAVLYPLPLARSRFELSSEGAASLANAAGDHLAGIRVGLEIAALSLFRMFSPRPVLLALGSVMELLGRALHRFSTRVEEQYYFPALLLVGIATVFVFLS